MISSLTKFIAIAFGVIGIGGFFISALPRWAAFLSLCLFFALDLYAGLREGALSSLVYLGVWPKTYNRDEMPVFYYFAIFVQSIAVIVCLFGFLFSL